MNPNRCWSLVAALLVFSACDDDVGDPFARGESAYARAEYPAARAFYEQALRSRGSLRAPVSAARIQSRLGLTLRKLGERDAAETVLLQAIDEAGRAGDERIVAVTRRYLGRLYADEGRLEAAMSAYDAALAYHRERGPPNDPDLLKLQIQRGGAAWQAGDFAAAWHAYSDVYDRSRALEETAVEAAALDGLAMLMSQAGELGRAQAYQQEAAALHAEAGRWDALSRSLATAAIIAQDDGRPLEARAMADRALALALSSGDRRQALHARLVLADAWQSLGDPGRALGQARRVLDAAHATGSDVLLGYAELAAGLAEEALGHTDEAEASLRRVPEETDDLDAQGLAAAARGRMALARGDDAAGVAALSEAVRRFDALRGGLEGRPLVGFQLADRLAVYERLVVALVGLGRTADALEVVARFKARAFVDRLLRLRSADGGGSGVTARDVQLAANRADVARETAEHRPSFKVAELQAVLPDDLGVIDYDLLDDELLVFWVSRSRVAVRRVPVTRAEVKARVLEMERGIAQRGRAFEAPARWLARRVLDPIAAELNGARRPTKLCVIPHGVLHRLPFEVLPWAGGYLIDRLPVFSVPSLPALHALLTAPPLGKPERVVAVGDAKDDLPGARTEVQRIAGLFDERRILVGMDARESVVAAALPAADVIHFAVHGEVTATGAPGYLELQPDSGSDGRLNADEIARLRLNAALVVLSACDSGVGRPNRADEIVGVMDRAFLYAGARSVISSRWRISDAATVLFMERFYQGLRKKGRLVAFADAQRALRSGRLTVKDLSPPLLASLDTVWRGFRPSRRTKRAPDFTHPYYWASLALKGDFR